MKQPLRKDLLRYGHRRLRHHQVPLNHQERVAGITRPSAAADSCGSFFELFADLAAAGLSFFRWCA